MFGAGDRLDNAMRMAEDSERERRAERELLVKALLALRGLAEERLSAGHAVTFDGACPQCSQSPHAETCGYEDRSAAAFDVLSDPLAVELLKEADRG